MEDEHKHWMNYINTQRRLVDMLPQDPYIILSHAATKVKAAILTLTPINERIVGVSIRLHKSFLEKGESKEAQTSRVETFTSYFETYRAHVNTVDPDLVADATILYMSGQQVFQSLHERFYECAITLKLKRDSLTNRPDIPDEWELNIPALSEDVMRLLGHV